MSLRRRLAVEAQVPVFAAPGVDAELAHIELAADPRVRLVASPRHAVVLVALGRFPASLEAAFDRVHDQLPHPRGIVRCSVADLDGTGGNSVVGKIVGLHRSLLEGSRESSPDRLADEPPNPFEGLGDHGQGGEGMMGGVPWGRPMAMTGDDRDGLALDRSSVRMGPFLVGLPSGVAVDAVLQGGVVEQAELVMPAVSDPVLPPDSELDRCRHLLRWISEACRLGGLESLSVSAAAMARTVGSGRADDSDIARLVRRVRRSGLARTWRGIGKLDGVGEDAADRLERYLGEVVSTAEAANDGRGPDSTVEPSWTGIAPGSALQAVIERSVVGFDWSAALVTLCSLDLRAVTADQVAGTGSAER